MVWAFLELLGPGLGSHLRMTVVFACRGKIKRRPRASFSKVWCGGSWKEYILSGCLAAGVQLQLFQVTGACTDESGAHCRGEDGLHGSMEVMSEGTLAPELCPCDADSCSCWCVHTWTREEVLLSLCKDQMYA